MARESVFSSRDFRLFYFGQATSYIGDGLRTIALPLLVFKLTGSALNLGLTFSLEWFSFGVFSLIGGSLADRLNRKRLMISADVIRSLIILSFALGYRIGWLTLPLLYGGIVLHTACGAVFNGGQASSIPYVLGKARATRAVAALIGTESAVNTAVPPIGGAIFGLFGPFPALIINAATYVASILSLGAVRDLGPERTSGFPRIHHVASDIGIGFRFLFADNAMRIVTFASFMANFWGSLGFTAYVPFIKRDLGGTDFSVGVVFGALGAGTVLGAFLASRVHTTFGRNMVIGYLWSFIQLGLIWTHNVTVAAIILGLLSVAGGWNVSTTLGWRMRIIPQETVGRVFGAARLLVLCGTLPGALLGGVIADRYGARTAVAISAIGISLVIVWLVANRTVREEKR